MGREVIMGQNIWNFIKVRREEDRLHTRGCLIHGDGRCTASELLASKPGRLT